MKRMKHAIPASAIELSPGQTDMIVGRIQSRAFKKTSKPIADAEGYYRHTDGSLRKVKDKK